MKDDGIDEYTKEDLDNIIEFIKKNNDNVLIHCMMGRSQFSYCNTLLFNKNT